MLNNQQMEWMFQPPPGARFMIAGPGAMAVAVRLQFAKKDVNEVAKWLRQMVDICEMQAKMMSGGTVPAVQSDPIIEIPVVPDMDDDSPPLPAPAVSPNPGIGTGSAGPLGPPIRHAPPVMQSLLDMTTKKLKSPPSTSPTVEDAFAAIGLSKKEDGSDEKQG